MSFARSTWWAVGRPKSVGRQTRNSHWLEIIVVISGRLRPKRSDETAYYLYEMDSTNLDSNIRVLAKFVSEDAAISLGRSLQRQLGSSELEPAT